MLASLFFLIGSEWVTSSPGAKGCPGTGLTLCITILAKAENTTVVWRSSTPSQRVWVSMWYLSTLILVKARLWSSVFFSCHTGDLWEGGVHPLHWVWQWIRSGDEEKTGFLGHAVENNRWGWEKVNSQRYPGGSGHFYVWGRNCYNIFMLECCYILMAWFQLSFLQYFAGSWHYCGCHELGHTLVRFPSWSPKKGTTRTIWGFWCVKPNCAS